MMENKYVFIKKYTSKHIAKRRCSCNLQALQETKNFPIFDKSCTQENAKCHMNKVDLEGSYCTVKLQVTLLFALFPERNYARTFSKPLRKK